MKRFFNKLKTLYFHRERKKFRNFISDIFFNMKIKRIIILEKKSQINF